MAQKRSMKFYAYNTSVSYKTEVFQPGDEIPLAIIKAIPRVNLRVLLGTGQIITQGQREAIEEAARIVAAKDVDQLPPIGCGKDKFIDELQLNPGATAGVGLGVAAIKEKRGEAPLREIEDFLDDDGEIIDADFVDEPKIEPAPTAQEISGVDLATDEAALDFADAPSADAVEGETEPPLESTDSILGKMFEKDEE